MLAVRLSLVLAGAWLALPAGAPLAAAGPPAILLALIASADAAWLGGGRVGLGLGAASGVFALGLAIVAPDAWVPSAFALAIVCALSMAGAARGKALGGILAAGGLGLVLPLAMGVGLAASGLADPGSAVRAALPPDPAARLAVAAARALVVVFALRRRAGRLFVPLAVAVLAALGARLAYVVGLAQLDSELFWPEAPMLVNALKLGAGEALYGPREALASYSYAPLLDVVHRALLRPFGLDLDLFAHRALILADQAAAAGILLFALRPRLRALGRAGATAASLLLVLACFGNLLAPAVHPDHPLLVCFAVAMLLVVDGERLPARVRDVLLVLVTPVAVGFKLSGGGIGIALAGLALVRRRPRDLALLAFSGLLSAATVPLFDALFGDYSFYAITLQRSHPMEFAHLTRPEWLPFGAALACATLAVLAARVTGRSAPRAERALALTLAMAAASLPAAAKYAGRENNAAVVLVGAVFVLALVAAETPRWAGVVLSSGTWLALAAVPVRAAPDAAARAEIAADTARMADVVREDAAAGERTLLLTSVLPWIRAGRRDVPRDRWHSAIELSFGKYPEGRLLPERIASGTYASVVASGSELGPLPGPAEGFQRAVAAALDARYEETSGRTRARVYRRRAP